MSITIQEITDALFRKPIRLYAVFLLLIIALKWSFFSIPPVWDEAFSIFPAADFLVTHGFDYSRLSTYYEGGQNAHAFSLLTLVTALVLKLTGGGKTAWFILHIMQWLMAAAIGTMLTRIYSTLFDKMPAFLLSVATLSYPLMLAQMGSMYIEVPLLFFTLSAFYYYHNDRILISSLSLVAACMIKESGVIAVMTMALLVLCGDNEPVRKRFKKACILAIPSIVMFLVILVITGFTNDLSTAVSHSNTFRNIFNAIIDTNLLVYQGYISHIPELIIIFAESILISTFFLSKNFYQRMKMGRGESDIMIFNCLFIITFSIFHFILYPLVQRSGNDFLSRYFFYAIPSMFFVIYYPIDKAIKASKMKKVLLFIIIGICLINRNGILYPSIPYSSIAMAERSEEYIDGYAVQKDYTTMIENKISPNVPVYVGRPDYFFTHYPVLKYVRKPLLNVYHIEDVIKSAGNSFQYPDHFVLVYDYPWLGGEDIQTIMEDLSGNNNFSFKVLGYFKKGDFSAYVIEIKKRRGWEVGMSKSTR
jgi:hypothetical protein